MDDVAIMSSEREVWVMGGDGDSDRDQCGGNGRLGLISRDDGSI